MAKFTDSLRGYSYAIHKRDQFKCRYCGADGAKSFSVWLTLSLDHLLPTGHPDRDKPDYTVTACRPCNEADNLYFWHAPKRGITFDGKTPDELVAQRLPYVLAVRQQYEDFWKAKVHEASEPSQENSPNEALRA